MLYDGGAFIFVVRNKPSNFVVLYLETRPASSRSNGTPSIQFTIVSHFIRVNVNLQYNLDEK